MILDNEQQREVLKAAIDAAQWQGQVVELVYSVKMALRDAQIGESATQEPEQQQ